MSLNENEKPKTAKFIIHVWAQESFTQDPEIQKMKKSVFDRSVFEGTVTCARCKEMKGEHFHAQHELSKLMVDHKRVCKGIKQN